MCLHATEPQGRKNTFGGAFIVRYFCHQVDNDYAILGREREKKYCFAQFFAEVTVFCICASKVPNNNFKEKRVKLTTSMSNVHM